MSGLHTEHFAFLAPRARVLSLPITEKHLTILNASPASCLARLLTLTQFVLCYCGQSNLSKACISKVYHISMSFQEVSFSWITQFEKGNRFPVFSPSGGLSSVTDFETLSWLMECHKIVLYLKQI